MRAGGKRLAIAGVLGKSGQKQIHNNEIEMSDPETALRRIVPEMKREGRLPDPAGQRHAGGIDGAWPRQFPEFNLVVTAGGNAEPPAQPTVLNGGKTLLVQVGEKGEHAIVVGFFADPQASAARSAGAAGFAFPRLARP